MFPTLTASMGMGGGFVPMVIKKTMYMGFWDNGTGKHQANSLWGGEVYARQLPQFKAVRNK